MQYMPYKYSLPPSWSEVSKYFMGVGHQPRLFGSLLGETKIGLNAWHGKELGDYGEVVPAWILVAPLRG